MSASKAYSRIVLVGDSYGIEQLLEYVPQEIIVGIIGASIRPRYLDDLRHMAQEIGVSLLVQPRYDAPEYNDFVDKFAGLSPDLLLCHSYSMILRQEILETVQYNAINVHTALLPKNRGPNPVQWAIIRGERETGVTIHYMDEGLDSGDIIAQKKVSIRPDDTWVSLRSRLQTATCDLLEKTLPDILLGRNSRSPQDDRKATANHRLDPEFPRIDFDTMSDRQIYDLIRAQVAPLKGAYIEKEEERIFIDTFMTMEQVRQLRRQHG